MEQRKEYRNKYDDNHLVVQGMEYMYIYDDELLLEHGKEYMNKYDDNHLVIQGILDFGMM